MNSFRKKNINNLFNLNMNNEVNTFKEFKFKVIKLIMFNDN